MYESHYYVINIYIYYYPAINIYNYPAINFYKIHPKITNNQIYNYNYKYDRTNN